MRRLGGIWTLTLALTACAGSDTKDDGQGGAALSCTANTMRLKGQIDGTAVDRTESVSGSGLTQLGAGHFDSLYVGRNLINDPERSWVVLDWPSAVANGARSTATGTLTLPATEPRGNQALCAREGTFVGFNDDGTFYFGLRSIAAGSACDVPVAGNIDGCWNSAH